MGCHADDDCFHSIPVYTNDVRYKSFCPAELLGLFYIAQTGVVAAYMGATAYMAGKPMGNKMAMTTKDMR